MSDESTSDRYELDDLFDGEGATNQHFVKMVGIVILVGLLLLALGYPVFFLLD